MLFAPQASQVLADVNMPVIVYPGDGSPVAHQLSLITTNDQGEPNNPA